VATPVGRGQPADPAARMPVAFDDDFAFIVDDDQTLVR
jgi:hypothetical protein